MQWTKAQAKILEALGEHDELTEKRLMRVADMGGPQGTAAVCRTLMSHGVIERERVAQRSDLDSFYRYRITDAGRKALEAIE